MKKKLKKYMFHIIMCTIVIILFVILKNIELTQKCEYMHNCIPCPCTYDVPGFLILKALKGYIVPFIVIIYFIVEVIRLTFNFYRYNKIKKEIVYSLLLLVAIYFLNYTTNLFLNTFSI